jgi:uncharacterized membrane protein
MRYRLAALAALCLAAALPNVSRAAHVRLENYSNGTVYVAVSYNQYRGNLIVEGWYEVKQNATWNFDADDASDMYIRVQDANGREITFANHNQFLFWAAHPDRFSLARKPDDANVRHYRWGANLQNNRNATLNEPLPPGWDSRRFFRIGSGNHKLEVKP